MATSLSAAIGQRLREWRDEHGIRQDEFASACRSTVGLQWTGPTVAAVETGRRDMALEELLLLPVIMRHFTDRATPLPDLIPVDGWVTLTPTRRAGVDWVKQALSGKPYEAASGPTKPAQRRHQQWRDVTRARDVGVTLGLAYDGLGWQRLADDAAGEAERKAARRLGVEPLTISAAAHALWGHGLTTERDERVHARFEDEAIDDSTGRVDRRRIQALRGHVTRALLAELRERIDQTTDEE